MHVDRTRFLILTAAIAAGCGASHKQEPAPTPLPTSDEYDTTVGKAPPPEPVPTTQIAAEEMVDPPPEMASDPQMPPPTVEDPGFEHGGYAGALAARDPALSQKCARIKRPGPVCESFYDTLDSCDRYSTVMVPKAATAAVGCLTKRSGTKRICEFGVDATCATEGTKAAPRDPGAKAICRSMLNACAGTRYRGKDMTQSNCEAAVSGYSSVVRSRLVSCIAEFCEIRSCFYQVM